MKTAALYRNLLLSLIILSSLLTACSTVGKSEILAPEWFKSLSEAEDESCSLIKVSTFAVDKSEASEKALTILFDRLMEYSAYQDQFSDQQDREELKSMLRSVMDTEESLPGIISLQRQEWVLDDGNSYYYGAFCIDPAVSETLNDYLIDRYYSRDEVLNTFLGRAERYEAEGKFYRAAEELLEAAIHVQQQSEPLSLDISQLYIQKAGSLLARITVSGVQAPDEAFVNLMIEEPFHMLCSSGDVPVEDVEFLVRYEGKGRDGEKSHFERRLVSNPGGILEFYHPFIPFPGEAAVSFTPGSRDFHSSIKSLGDKGLDVEILVDWLGSQTQSYTLTVASAPKTVPMGIVLLHTDITGTALETDDSSVGLAESLNQEGFRVNVMSLDPAEVYRGEESAFLRDIRAFYNDDYTRVIYGTVGIRDFEDRGDSYRVKTGGNLKVVDVDSGEILISLNLEKTVESRSNTLAVTASFRELGKAFAQKMKERLQ